MWTNVDQSGPTGTSVDQRGPTETNVGSYQNREGDGTSDVRRFAHGYVSRVLVDLENVALVP